MPKTFDGHGTLDSGGDMAKAGWWLAAAVLPVAIWPALDWGHPTALSLTDYWFARTGHMPSWAATSIVEAASVGVFAVASGLVLFFALRGIKRAGAPDGVGWLAALVSLVIALGTARSLPNVLGDLSEAGAVLLRAVAGFAMAAGAVAAQLLRRRAARPAAPPDAP